MHNDRWSGEGLSLGGRACFKNMFGGGSTIVQQAAATPMPTPTPPPPMPDPFGPASMAAARRAGQSAANRGGRSSTELTTAASRASGTIAGGGASTGTAAPYSANTLGGAS